MDDEPVVVDGDVPPWFAPLKNASTFRVVDWSQNSSTTKSQADTQRFVDEVIHAPDFDRDELVSFNLQKELNRLDEPPLQSKSIDDLTSSHSGWQQTSVPIPIPDGKKRTTWDGLEHFVVKKLALRQLLPII